MHTLQDVVQGTINSIWCLAAALGLREVSNLVLVYSALWEGILRRQKGKYIYSAPTTWARCNITGITSHNNPVCKMDTIIPFKDGGTMA